MIVPPTAIGVPKYLIIMIPEPPFPPLLGAEIGPAPPPPPVFAPASPPGFPSPNPFLPTLKPAHPTAQV